MSNFSTDATQKNREQNAGQDEVGGLRSAFKELSNHVSSTELQLTKYDVSSKTNQNELAEITKQSEYLSSLVSKMDELRNTDTSDLGAQLVASKTLKHILKQISENTDINDDQKNLLIDQGKILQSGFSKSDILLEHTKESLAKYSDAAVAGITSLFGNSPVTLLLTKLVTDQAKSFFARRKEAKKQRAELAKQNVLSKARMNKADSIATQVNIENTRENVKQGTKHKFKNYLTKEDGGVIGLIFKTIFKILRSPLALLAGAIGTSILLFGKLKGAIIGIVSAIAGMLKKIHLPKLLGGKGSPVTKKVPKVNIASRAKGFGSKALKYAKVGGRFLGGAGAVAGAGYLGYESGKYFNKHVLTNADGTNKLDGVTNGVFDFIHGSSKERKAKFAKQQEDMAKKKGFSSYSKMMEHNHGKKAKLEQSSKNSINITADIVRIFTGQNKNDLFDTGDQNRGTNFDGSLRLDHRKKLFEKRSAIVGNIKAGLDESKNSNSPAQNQAPVVISTNSNVDNSTQQAVIGNLTPSNPEPNYVMMSTQGAL